MGLWKWSLFLFPLFAEKPGKSADAGSFEIYWPTTAIQSVFGAQTAINVPLIIET